MVDPVIDCGVASRVSCARAVFFFILAVSFFSVCFALFVRQLRRQLQRYASRRPAMWLFLLASIHTFIISLNYGFLGLAQLTFLAMYVKLLMFSYVTFVFSRNALTILNRRELVSRLLLPFISFAVFVVTVLVAIYIIVTSNGTVKPGDCKAPLWIIISLIGFILALVFLSTALVVLRALPHAMIPAPKRQKRRELFVMLVSFFVSQTALFIFNIFLVLVPDHKCEQFTSNQAVWVLVIWTERLLDLFLPLAALVYVEFGALRRAGKPIMQTHAHEAQALVPMRDSS